MKQRLPEAGPSMDIRRINAAATPLPVLSISEAETVQAYYTADLSL